jgi:D-Tyr-tRNAtyr deacylase
MVVTNNANNNGVAEQPAYLTTPRSMMPGSWVCDSPKVIVEPDKSEAQKLSIQIPKLEEHTETEQRDAAEGERHSAREGTPSSHDNDRSGLPPLPADTSLGKFECDYDSNPTDIFMNLQKKEWDSAAKRSIDHPTEARTWVSRKEKHGKLRWRLLPIHAAIIFKAPEKVVENLLAAYPKGAQSKDDQGMLPLHLAFRHGSTEGTVNLLLVAFPQSVEVKDRKGRIPLVLAQASASPNRDAFVRALERGPTYYASAAAATERAAVTAEQRAIFDSKLIEVEKKHQQDVNILKEERKGLEETVDLLQKELAKQKGATQVLVDHVNSLEAQLNNKSDTERFLAVKAATFDSDLKELTEAKEQMEKKMAAEIAELKKTNTKLRSQMQVVLTDKGGESVAEANPDEFKVIRDKAAKQEKEMKSLKMDWASAQARAAVLEAQLKSKIENEHELASQVSHLAAKLAESAQEKGSASHLYSKKIQTLEGEREKLRAAVNELGKKLLKVSQFMNKMTMKAQENTRKQSKKSKDKRSKLLADAFNHEQLIRTAMEERKQMADMLRKQEEEMTKSARQHQEILDKLAELQNRPESPEPDNIAFSESLTDELHDVMCSVLEGLPKQESSEDGELVDVVMNNAVLATPKARGSRKGEDGAEDTSSKISFFAPLRASDTDIDEDPQKCLENALKALELSRAKSRESSNPSLKSMSEESVESAASASLSGNPSDELSSMNKNIEANHSEDSSSSEESE